MTVHGKRDKHPIKLLLWKNRVNSFLCPVNALLWWLATTNIKAGYIFRDADNLTANRPISYGKFFDMFVEALEELSPAGKWGSHSIRKTGFLLATWGGAGDTDVASSARCKVLETVSNYRENCKTLEEYARARGYRFSHLVDVWRPCRVGQLDSTYKYSPQTAALACSVLISKMTNIFKRMYPLCTDAAKMIELSEMLRDLGHRAESVKEQYKDLLVRSLNDISKCDYLLGVPKDSLFHQRAARNGSIGDFARQGSLPFACHF